MTILQLILGILTALPGLIQAAEQVFGGKPGTGAAKKELVLGVVRSGVQLAAQAGVKELQNPDNATAVVSAADKLTDGIVAALNVAEVFRHERAGS